MGYEINVSKDGRHYFATHERTLQLDNVKTAKMVMHFEKVFPADEGYKISINYKPAISYGCNVNEDGTMYNPYFDKD